MIGLVLYLTHAALGQIIAQPNCLINPTLVDPIAQALSSQSECPRNVFQFRSLLKKLGFKLETTLVANRGFHNQSQGSLSIFEFATLTKKQSGDFFFGHFTKINKDGLLVADQDPSKDALMIEAFAWDKTKGYYNFYELRGTGGSGQWFYRGDSADIFADNHLLHRQRNPRSTYFGNTLRCSACHSSGGPIMKELDSPHNDWWTPLRKLDLGGRAPDTELLKIFKTLVPASRLASEVKAGLKKLNTSQTFQKIMTGLTLQERLRPLFCPLEINFQSDLNPNSARSLNIKIPTGFFVNTSFLKKTKSIFIKKTDYKNALKALGSLFPETNQIDADHAWLTPVKAASDEVAIQSLVNQGLIDVEFVNDVLAVDFTNPVFSNARCSLLKLVPHSVTHDWKENFINQLSKVDSKEAKELYRNILDPTRNFTYFNKRSIDFLNLCKTKLLNSKKIIDFVRLLNQRRGDIQKSEISQNPLGQILEPGFRLIFPVLSNVSQRELSLSDSCEVVTISTLH